MSRAPKAESPAERRGRRIGIALFSAVVVGFTAVCSVQIILQAWAPSEAPPGTCRDGVVGLVKAVDRARGQAAGATGGEREALAAFRRALEPEWTARAGLGERCSGDAEGERALAEVDRLRYAEEHALRHEALDVARLRRNARDLTRGMGQTP